MSTSVPTDNTNFAIEATDDVQTHEDWFDNESEIYDLFCDSLPVHNETSNESSNNNNTQQSQSPSPSAPGLNELFDVLADHVCGNHNEKVMEQTFDPSDLEYQPPLDKIPNTTQEQHDLLSHILCMHAPEAEKDRLLQLIRNLVPKLRLFLSSLCS